MSAEKPVCLQLKVGNCRGCNVLNLVATRSRWHAIKPEEASSEIAPDYCPPGVTPQHHLVRNDLASSGMGQRATETFEFDNKVNAPGRKLHGRY